MIVNDSEAASRLNSPMNLINQLRSNGNRKNNAMQLFGIGRSADRQSVEIVSIEDKKEEVTVTFNPFSKPPAAPPSPSPTLDTILEDNESQIQLGLAHDNAIKLLNNSITSLADKLDNVRADKLPSVITAASKTIESIRKERNEKAKNGKDRDVHFHFYTPEQKKITDYEVIDVT